MTVVGDAIRKARRDKGWSQQLLADRAGLSLDWVRSTESGRTTNPRMETVAKAALALGVSADSLVLGEPEATPLPDGVTYISPERMQVLNASFLTLQRLSPKGLEAASEFLEVFARMDEEEFQNPRRKRE